MFDLWFRLVMWRIFFVSEALMSAMKRSGFGGNNSGQCLHQRLREKGVTRRVVYHEGDVLEGYVSKSRDQKLLWKSIKRNCQYKIIVAQKLRSYRAVMTVIENADRQEAGRWLNNRAENSRLPLRRRERAILRFRRTQPVQKFVIIERIDLGCVSNPMHVLISLTAPSALKILWSHHLSWASLAQVMDSY